MLEINSYNDLYFEKLDYSRAYELLEFIKSVGDTTLYAAPLTEESAYSEIRDNIFNFIKPSKGSDIILGTASYVMHPDRTCYFGNLLVHPDYRGKSIARFAMEFMLDKCKAASVIGLTVHPDNVAALKLYYSFGFVMDSQIEDYYGDGEPRLLLKKYQGELQ